MLHPDFPEMFPEYVKLTSRQTAVEVKDYMNTRRNPFCRSHQSHHHFLKRDPTIPNKSMAWVLSVWSLHVLHVSVWLCARAQSKFIHVWLTGDFKLAVGVNTRVCVWSMNMNTDVGSNPSPSRLRYVVIDNGSTAAFHITVCLF